MNTRRAPVPLSEAGRALLTGAAVVLPNPAPLTHVVTATRAGTVNEAKGRPARQPVALWAHHPDTLHALGHVWDLDPATAAMARWLLAEEHLTVLVPVRDPAGAPAWTAPAVKDGWMLLFGTRWEPLRPLLDAHPVLYVSSANRTGRPPAATTAEALAMFPDRVHVLEPAATNPADTTPRAATTTVRLHTDGSLELHRHGAQNRHDATPDHYLRQLRARYRRVEFQITQGQRDPQPDQAHTA
ncbi:Sua5/YciO/YrdC/YwlC family protein [Streptomyces sp. NPDC089915]|uniref:Sua5/YciO/YrdC/YwlC family protein n=1 Tax=Streptomyces sp. NPDC089915 TaxID=3155186 RepID=UPI0034481BD6